MVLGGRLLEKHDVCVNKVDEPKFRKCSSGNLQLGVRDFRESTSSVLPEILAARGSERPYLNAVGPERLQHVKQLLVHAVEYEPVILQNALRIENQIARKVTIPCIGSRDNYGQHYA
jgi:hypothetical protein